MSKTNITANNSTPSLKDQFQLDKEFLLQSTEQYLSKNPTEPTADSLKYDEATTRKQITANIASGDFAKAVEDLEILREQKTHIARITIGEEGKTPVTIRDARNAKEPPFRDTEAFEMQYLNATRAAIELAEIELLKNEKNEEFNNLKNALNEKASNYFANFHKNNSGSSQDEILSKNNAELKDLILTLESHGIRDARNKLNVAKEFQNFKNQQSNISTITKVNHKGHQYSVVESEVALRGLTEEQKNEYIRIKNNNNPMPVWFTSMPETEKALTLKHIDAILAGKHVISTQLRQLVGMKNAFEKITAIKPINSRNDGKFEVLHTSKHAGCLASFSHDQASRQGICNMNTRQAQEWIGPGKILHCNTFNSSTIGTKADRIIIEQTEQMLQQVPSVKLTNSAFNALRLSRLANNYDGSKNILEGIVNGLAESKELASIKKYLDPKNSLSIYNDITNKHESIKREIDSLKGKKLITEEKANVLKCAADLKYSISKAERTFNLDINNINADISVHLNKLNNAVAKLPKESNGGASLLQEEVLNMCASGKDRTGFAEHDQTVRAVADKISSIQNTKVEAKDLDKQVLVGGHTANQAGSIAVGGNTVGCFGTKKDNIQSLPVHRMANLVGIIEVSAGANNLPEPSGSEVNKASHQHEKQKLKAKNSHVVAYAKPTISSNNKVNKNSKGARLP